MRILLFGILSFLGWSTISTYIYVCKIKGLCDASVTMPISDVSNEKALTVDTLQKPIASIPIAIPKDLIIYFAFDKSEFNSSSIKGNFMNESKAYMNQNTKASLEITGHTDAIGTNAYNDALGYRRAQAVQIYFVSRGVPKNLIEIKSSGEIHPADNNNTHEGRANNRRTVITIKK